MERSGLGDEQSEDVLDTLFLHWDGGGRFRIFNDEDGILQHPMVVDLRNPSQSLLSPPRRCPQDQPAVSPSSSCSPPCGPPRESRPSERDQRRFGDLLLAARHKNMMGLLEGATFVPEVVQSEYRYPTGGTPFHLEVVHHADASQDSTPTRSSFTPPVGGDPGAADPPVPSQPSTGSDREERLPPLSLSPPRFSDFRQQRDQEGQSFALPVRRVWGAMEEDPRKEPSDGTIGSPKKKAVMRNPYGFTQWPPTTTEELGTPGRTEQAVGTTDDWGRSDSL